jgi:hypothetical protein
VEISVVFSAATSPFTGADIEDLRTTTTRPSVDTTARSGIAPIWLAGPVVSDVAVGEPVDGGSIELRVVSVGCAVPTA